MGNELQVRPLTFLLALLLALAGVPARGSAEPVILQGTHNTRDLGGIPVQGGQVRPHMVYRSGALCFLTPADSQKLGFVRTVIDLRVPRELTKEGPDRLQAAVVPLPMTNSRGLGQEAYHYYIRENPAAIAGFWNVLADRSRYPVLFHCSAGKDRTGILAALLLESLGAERSVITGDYLQSIRNSPKLVVHEEWLGEVYQAVDEAGGIEAFLVQNGVSRQRQLEVRQLLVEER